jgi:hypothetical protein
MREIGDLARDQWRGTWNGAAARHPLRLLSANGPHGPVWWRYATINGCRGAPGDASVRGLGGAPYGS